MSGNTRQTVLEEILTGKQIDHVLKQCFGEVSWVLKGSEVRPVSDGITGFLGDHKKAVLHVDVKDEQKKVHLFIKRIPTYNKPKADFIDENNYFKREKLMLKILDEICENGLHPWCVKAYIYTDSMIVMPDVSVQGYSTGHFLDTLDSEHIFSATTSIARFHAAYVNYETNKSIDLSHPYRISQDFANILTEPLFCDSTWLRTCSKLSTNILKTFSTKFYRNLPDLESRLSQLYLRTCDSLTEYKDTLNVLIHKDLSVHNIMFKNDNNGPSNAVLVDYQCLRYAPPAFDLMIFLYYTTDKGFRQERESDVFDHYYSVFAENLSEGSKDRLKALGYNKDDFLKWCEKARMFGMFEAISIYPYNLMDPKTAQATFDDPETYEKYLNEDRSEPVIAHAMRCEAYRERNLAVTEEFVETYVLDNL